MTSTELDSREPGVRRAGGRTPARLQRLAALDRAGPRDRPYADVDSLLDTAEHAARALDWAEVQQALDAHPRIGERADGASTEAQWSRREQSAVGTSDAATQDALRAGNAAYERRFGHVFLIRAAGRSAEEMAAELDRRLANDDARERAEVTEQLAQITRLRVQSLLAG